MVNIFDNTILCRNCKTEMKKGKLIPKAIRGEKEKRLHKGKMRVRGSEPRTSRFRALLLSSANKLFASSLKDMSLAL